MVRLPQKGAERANQATKGVPMGRIPWETSEPKHFEVDHANMSCLVFRKSQLSMNYRGMV
jgi:hypothetical protein